MCRPRPTAPSPLALQRLQSLAFMRAGRPTGKNRKVIDSDAAGGRVGGMTTKEKLFCYAVARVCLDHGVTIHERDICDDEGVDMGSSFHFEGPEIDCVEMYYVAEALRKLREAAVRQAVKEGKKP